MTGQKRLDMPAIWGYGNAGTEPGTMAGWGYPSNAAASTPSAIYKAEEMLTSYSAEEMPTSYSAEGIETSYTAKADEE